MHAENFLFIVPSGEQTTQMLCFFFAKIGDLLETKIRNDFSPEQQRPGYPGCQSLTLGLYTETISWLNCRVFVLSFRAALPGVTQEIYQMVTLIHVSKK